MRLRHPAMFLSDNLTKRYSHTKTIWYIDKVMFVTREMFVRERVEGAGKLKYVLVMFLSENLTRRYSHTKIISYAFHTNHEVRCVWGASTRRWQRRSDLKYIRRRRSDSESLQLPKFLTSFHWSPCTYKTRFQRSPEIFKRFFSWVNAVPVTQKIDQENWSILRSTYSKSDLLRGWEMRCNMTRSHCDMTRSHVSESCRITSHASHTSNVFSHMNNFIHR